jgi:hypothetical protein
MRAIQQFLASKPSIDLKVHKERRDRYDGGDALAEHTCSPSVDTLWKLLSLVFDARRGVSVRAFGGQRIQGAPSVIAKVGLSAFRASNKF